MENLKYTIQERNEIYKKALDVFGTSVNGFRIDCLCWALVYAVGMHDFFNVKEYDFYVNAKKHPVFAEHITNGKIYMDDVLGKELPEFISQKPIDACVYWFDNKDKSVNRKARIEVLTKCIEMTDKKATE